MATVHLNVALSIDGDGTFNNPYSHPMFSDVRFYNLFVVSQCIHQGFFDFGPNCLVWAEQDIDERWHVAVVGNSCPYPLNTIATCLEIGFGAALRVA